MACFQNVDDAIDVPAEVLDDDLERLARAVLLFDVAVGVDHSSADEQPDVLLGLALEALKVESLLLESLRITLGEPADLDGVDAVPEFVAEQLICPRGR